MDAAFDVHRALGPGFVESVYKECMVAHLASRGWRVEEEVVVPIIYEGKTLRRHLRLDLLVERSVVEVKSVEALLPVHLSQLRGYLKLSGVKLGYLINFNEAYVSWGFHRVVQT